MIYGHAGYIKKAYISQKWQNFQYIAAGAAGRNHIRGPYLAALP